ncbi:MAG TPA: glycosyltransferase family 4 protein [Acidisphaera sp.]|nr:glycosyltransferase family 4 protein [Acidisphaera sp.]
MRVAVVLPPREGFGPGRAGAIGLLTRRLADEDTLVVGGRQAGPIFDDAAFVPAPPSLLGLSANARYAAGVLRLLRRNKPELVEVYNRPDIALALAVRLTGVPVVMCLQNDPQGMHRIAPPAARGQLLARMAGAIVASEWLRHQLLQGVSEAAERIVHVLPNCLDLHEVPPPNGAARDKVILFVGRVVADKGADAFVAACARALPRLPGWRAEIIGADRMRADSPETPFVQALRPAAAAAGVTLAGYRPHDAVLDAMSRAAIVAVPSRWEEPFGLTALEAMACGAALVTSGRGALREVADDTAVYADPDDPEALAEAFVLLAEDPVRRAALGAAGQHRARAFDAAEARLRLADIRSDIAERWSRLASPPI